ncbi:MAG: conjugal transfer protein, partial [Lactobacillus sp.]|nr:conjugal transfer protein [Lactobacillus sp.]
MSKKDLELLNIEVGTFKRVNDKLTLKIDQSQFRYDSLAELNELKTQEPNFLHLQNIVEQDSQVVLTYGLSKEAKSLKHLPTEKKAIRTAIAKQIMTQDVLRDGKYHISLNPANIWYYPMTNVWYAYRANELMPFDDKFNSLSKYKALVLYCLTGTPYERLLSEPKEALAQNQDELLQQIVNANDTEELKLAVKEIDDYVSYREWQDVDNKEQKSKKKLWITAGSIAIVA